MKKLLITGASGFLGWHLCQLAKSTWEVYGTYFSNYVDIPDVKMLSVNLTDIQQLKDVFSEIQPTAVIHTAAQSQPNFCQIHPQESHLINVTAACDIARLCGNYGIPCVFTSTDLVFDGCNGSYKETSPVSPINIYGEQKVMAEQGMLQANPLTTICRMPLMFGGETPTAKSFLQPFMQTLKSGKILNLFTDEFRTPVSGTTAAKGLLLALEKQISGILHLGGREKISRYDFGCLLIDILELPREQVIACRQKDVKMAAPRPADVSLDSSRAFAIGYSPLSVKKELEMIVDS